MHITQQSGETREAVSFPKNWTVLLTLSGKQVRPALRRSRIYSLPSSGGFGTNIPVTIKLNQHWSGPWSVIILGFTFSRTSNQCHNTDYLSNPYLLATEEQFGGGPKTGLWDSYWSEMPAKILLGFQLAKGPLVRQYAKTNQDRNLLQESRIMQTGRRYVNC